MPKKAKKDPATRNNSASKPDNEKIQRQLQRILNSSEFQATKSQREFLQFVVSETLAGRSHEIKGYTVATRVFGRQADFDANLDPIVSIQANKLRRALERYYLVAGQNDPVRIDIPKGTYVPTFRLRTDVEPAKSESGSDDVENRFEGQWPSVLVRPLQNLTGDPEKDYLGIGLATELVIEICRYQEIRALLYAPGGSERSA